MTTLLLVDDDADLLDLYGSLLGHHLHARVLMAKSAEEGLQILGREPIDLILSDYRMPDMDGLEFLGRARTLQPFCTRILMTAYSDPTIPARAQREDTQAFFLSKSLSPGELVRNVKDRLAHPGHSPGS